MPDSVVEADQITPSKVKDLWDKSLRATRAEREQASVNNMFVRNRQWVYWNRGSGRLEEVPRDPQRVRATVARIGPDTRRIVAKLLRRELTFDVPATTPDDAAIRASRVGEAALVEEQRRSGWEQIRSDHCWTTWVGGTGALCVEWDASKGTPVAVDEQGHTIGTGEVSVSCVSIHEVACEPGTRDLERARWWIRGVALPPPEVRAMYGLASDPPADARALDVVWRMGDGEHSESTPLTMVLTYWARPDGLRHQGRVMTVVNGQAVDDGPWPFPFTDRLNIAVARMDPVHTRWYGHTPVSDAVPVQAVYNASWSSIIEHMKMCGNARLWVPMGSVDDIEELTDTPGEAMEYNPINGLRPTYESPPVMPDWWIRQPQMLEAAMDDILNVHDVSRGQAPGGVESGLALSILSENDDTPTGALAKELGEAWGRAASMVLKLWEANVRETRQSTVHTGGVPEVVSWTGGDLLGQTTAVVPLDAVMPRSRAAQSAYAFQLYDRKIIQTPAELAKIADLPDQDDLVAGIDPDTARAQRENYWIAVGFARTVADIDDHDNHIHVHRDFMRSERFEYLDPKFQELMNQHMQAHQLYAADQAAAQTKAASVSPIAAALPTVATKPIAPDDVEKMKSLSESAPSNVGAGPNAAPSQTQPAPQPSYAQPGPTPGNGQPLGGGVGNQPNQNQNQPPPTAQTPNAQTPTGETP